MREYSIGVFDSGFGGLEILRKIVKRLPEYNYIYLGDSARAPYGTRSQDVIYTFTEQAVDFLFKEGCWLIILACNTASSIALRKIQREYLLAHYPNRRVLGVLIPAAEEAVERTKNNRVGVIGTEATVSSGSFERELKKLNPEINVFQKSCPLLVPIVEYGEKDAQVINLVIKNYLKPLLDKNIDTLILGCTHYGLLEEHIRKAVGKEISLILEGRVVAEKLEDYLNRHPEIESILKKDSKIRFLTTDLTDKFEVLGSQFFGKPIKPVKIRL